MRFLVLMTLFQMSLFGADPIGKIIAVEGVVTALSGGSERTLSRNAEIFVQELIKVSDDGRAQIQFTDGGLINLISGTEYRVTSYKFKKLFQKDKSSSELLKGGFRVLSGTIAKNNPANYEIKTPSATIGLRGTVLEAVISGPGLFVGVEQGLALIVNAVSSILIGEGRDSKYVHIPSRNQPAVLSVRRPFELERSLFSPPPGGLTIEQGQQQQQEGLQIEQFQGEGGDAPSGESTDDVPTIQEAPEDEGFDFEPGSGGASIQGGC